MLNISIYGKNYSFQYTHINNIPFEVISEWVVENKQVRTWLDNDGGWGLRKIFFIILPCLNDSFFFLLLDLLPGATMEWYSLWNPLFRKHNNVELLHMWATAAATSIKTLIPGLFVLLSV